MVHCVHVSPNRIYSVCYKDVTTCVGTAKIAACQETSAIELKL